MLLALAEEEVDDVVVVPMPPLGMVGVGFVGSTDAIVFVVGVVVIGAVVAIVIAVWPLLLVLVL